jgi:hypothetical protein
MNTDVKRFTAIVINKLDSGTSFGLINETNEQVFIRSLLAKRVSLEIGDEVEVVVVPNANNTGTCPWFALRVIVLQDDRFDDEDDMIDAELEQYDDDVLERLRENLERFNGPRKWAEEAYMFLDVNGPATTSQIARAVGYSTANIRTYLCKMHDRGEIVRADIRTSSAQSKASATVWALELRDFLPEESEL